MSRKNPVIIEDLRPRRALVCIYSPQSRVTAPEYYQEEFLSLVDTLKLPYDVTFFMKVRAIDNNMFLPKGKLEELKKFCDENNIEEMVCSVLLSYLQERNLTDALGCEILDREGLILEIFKKSAHTSEGKIQLEMAELEYMRTRTIGRGRELAQQAGFIGVKGPGETEDEKIKRTLGERFKQAKKRLDTLQRSRDVQRQQRLLSKIPLVCIIGYTNAGKSSVLNRLTKSDVLVENKLFATLDTTTRELFIDSKKVALVSDTVGFINQLPHNLIEAFKSTLEELRYANLLLHVIDCCNPAWQSQVKVVNETLQELGVEKDILFVFNKIDKLDSDGEQLAKLTEVVQDFQPHVLVHTKSKDGLCPLVKYLREYLSKDKKGETKNEKADSY